ncbi:integrase family protein [Methanohalobium evestigatum Z-7303]|uniref:Integrase family protein n=1 Tax=Methanohalobium evestigatum (strain ATCC BAA-1072 / DSM 3721 / NBRC 107634 / OCM 161 / Z-7303) TaxID=644295 RepID=D7E650_METEZ|nr:tyrosine-type recombinase/integrase [Methanohalobium evestigatum]ADI73072.1 integrase family protein [Methanohalobium evestigatum Z-7303]
MTFHGEDKKLKNMEKQIRGETYCEENKNLILKYKNILFAKSSSPHTVLNYLNNLNQISKMCEKPIENFDKDDIISLLGKIEQSGYKPSTKNLYRVNLKKFIKDMELDVPTDIIKTGKNSNQHKLPEDLITEHEAKMMIDSTSSLRDKALMSVLYESAARVGDLSELRIKDIDFNKRDGTYLRLDGKTGARRIKLIASTPYITSWLNNHPEKENQNAPVWLSKIKNQPLKYQGVRRVLKIAAEKAQIQKDIHPHLFRHSRSTFLANHLTPSQLESYMGWEHGSRMPAIYVHLSGQDLDHAIDKIHGKEDEEDEKDDSEFTNRYCPRCGKMNETTAKFCNVCGAALDITNAIEIDEKRNEVINKLMEMIANNPELAEMLKEYNG